MRFVSSGRVRFTQYRLWLFFRNWVPRSVYEALEFTQIALPPGGFWFRDRVYDAAGV